MPRWVGVMEICHLSFLRICLILENIFGGCGSRLKGMNEVAQLVGVRGR